MQVIKVYLHVHAKLYICDTALQFVTKKLFFCITKKERKNKNKFGQEI